MESHYSLLKCIARASLNWVGAGIAGDVVVDLLPVVCTDVYTWWSRERDVDGRRADVQALAGLSKAELKDPASAIVNEVAAGRPREERLRLTTFLLTIPGHLRRSLRRGEDPQGKTVPPGLFGKPEDLLQVIPSSPPRFYMGQQPLAGVDWKLDRLLGVGGFGEVWLARNPHLQNMPPAALKFCLDPKVAGSLRYEASVLDQVMQQGKHPGIVPLRHTYLKADPPCLEYEFIPGGDLADLAYRHTGQGGSLPPETVARIIRKLAQAVGYAHRLSPAIVHRDLKPANILCRQEGGKVTFHVTDFGIGAIVAGQSLEQTRRGSTSVPLPTLMHGAHTPLYASPQQREGRPPDPRDDIHALGVIWYQLLVGDFTRGAPAGGAWKKQLGKQGTRAELIDLLEECIETDAEARVADGAVLGERIDAILKSSVAVSVGSEKDRGTEDQATQTGQKEDQRETEDMEQRGDEESQEVQEKEQPGDSNTTLVADPLQQARDLLSAQEYAKAAKVLTAVLKANPSCVDAYRLRAQAYLGRNDTAKALQDASEVVKREGKSATSLLERARVYAARGEHDKAVNDLTQALIRDSQLLPALIARGQAYAARGQNDLAAADFSQALKLDSSASEVYLSRGMVRLGQQSYDAALADFEEGLRLHSDDPRFLVARGRVYLAQGKRAEALDSFIAAAHADPRCAEAYLCRGQVFLDQGDAKQAAEEFEQAIRLAPFRDAYLGKARAEVKLGKLGRAISSFSRALKVGGPDLQALLERGTVYRARGEIEAAIKDFQAALKIDRRSAAAYAERGAAYFLKGKHGQALKDLTQALVLDPARGEARVIRAWCHLHKNKPDEAVADATEVISQGGPVAEAHQVRGVAYQRKGLLAQALADLDEAIRLAPSDAGIRFTRGQVHQTYNSLDAALADYSEAIKLDNKDPAFYRARAAVYEQKGKTASAEADRARAAKLEAKASSQGSRPTEGE